jgi:PAS domain S-box-containing protein
MDPSSAQLEAENLKLRQSLTRLEAALRKAAGKRARTTRELRESRRELRLVADAMRESLLVVEAEGRILFANSRAARLLFHAEPDAVEGRNIAERLPREQAALLLTSYRQVLAAGRPLSREVAVTIAGEERWFLHRLAPIPFGLDNAAAVLSISLEITVRKAAEVATHRAREEAKAASRAKSEFLANMSHELRTPLNGVMGMLQILADTPLDQEQRQYAEIAIQSAQGMLALVNDLLDLSRIEAGGMPIQQEPLDLHDLLDSLCRVFHPTAQAKGVDLCCDVCPRVPRGMLGDPVRLRQVLFNLLGNAVKFTESGSVRLGVSSLPGPGGSGPPRLLFSVADSGVGMSDDQLSRVFQPFVQGDGSATRRFGGAGLGLAITRRLLDLMAGRLSVATAPGQGAEFAFVLPLRLAEPVFPAQPEPQAAPEPRPLRLLLAEDEPVNRLAARLMLERLGHRVALAGNGEEALDALAQEDFDCVLLDISMPVLDGLGVLRRLRTLEEQTGRPRTRVVAMTAHALAGDRERFLAEGCDGYLAKPVDLDELTRTLHDNAREVA